MLTRTGASLHIDAMHTRAICDEIGDRLRDVVRCQVSHELPPRLQDLMEQLAKADEAVSPSIAPSLDEIISQGQPAPHPRRSQRRSPQAETAISSR